MKTFLSSLAALIVVLSIGAWQAQYFEKKEVNPKGLGFLSFLALSDIKTMTFEWRGHLEKADTKELYLPDPKNLAFNSVPLKLLRAADKFSKTCSKNDLKKAVLIARDFSMSPNKLLAWNEALCKKNIKPFLTWLYRNPLIHPSGISYGKLLMKYKNDLPELATRDLEPRMHIKERSTLKSFDKWFLTLSENDQDRFFSDYQVIHLDQWVVTSKNTGDDIFEVMVYPMADVKRELVKKLNYDIFPALTSKECSFHQFDFCFVRKKKTLTWLLRKWKNIIFLDILIFLSLLLFIFWRQHRKRERKFLGEQAQLFQVISHEVRTPLTTIKLGLDKIRNNFDNLDEEGQKSILNTMESSTELEQIISRSLNEIQINEKTSQPFDINNVTHDLVVRKFDDLVDLKLSKETHFVQMPQFWFEICLANLIKNGLKHGQGQVSIKVSSEDKKVNIEVSDEGELSIKKLKAFLEPFKKNKKSNGLGLGLSIVKKRIEAYGGKFIIMNKPTRFTIQLKRKGNNHGNDRSTLC